MALMNQSKYARHRAELGLPGTTRQAVSKRVKEGSIPVVMQDGKALIDPAAADAAWSANTDPARAKASKPGPVKVREERDDEQARELTVYQEVRTKHENVKLLKAQAEYDQFIGKLIEREAVEAEAFMAMRVTRDQLRAMPGKLAPQLAQVTTPGEAARILELEVKNVLDELARRFKELPNAGSNISTGNQPPAGP